jgi:cytoskeletal protein CcmA (bactofilin family)
VLGKTTKMPEKRRDRGPIEAGDDTSVIAKDMRIIGDCSTKGLLRIHGKISGDVTARAVELTSTGSVQGDVAGSEGSDGDHAIVINGTVEGTVRATHVEVQRDGAVTGGVVADDVVVHGRVEGGILARNRLALEDAAAVEGDVRARRLALKEGGQVNGTILMGERAMTGLSNENQALEASGTSPKESGLAATAPREPPSGGPKRLPNDEAHASVGR